MTELDKAQTRRAELANNASAALSGAGLPANFVRAASNDFSARSGLLIANIVAWGAQSGLEINDCLSRNLVSSLSRDYRCWMELISGITARWLADRSSLENTFQLQTSLSELERVNTRLSDRHYHGRTVTSFKLAGGCVFYKPRSIRSEKAWSQIASEVINVSNNCEHRHIERDGYGWCLGEPQAPCASDGEFSELARNIGRTLSLAYFCGCTDMHGGNFVVNGSSLSWIDCETLLVPTFIEPIEPALEDRVLPLLLADSVARTGALPGIRMNDGVILHLRHYYAMNDCHRDSRDFVVKIEEGFVEAFNLVISNKNWLLGLVQPLATEQSFRSRVVLAPSRWYDKICALAHWCPPADSRAFLEGRLADPARSPRVPREVIEQETQALLRNEIPLFHAQDRDLVADGAVVVKDFFRESGLDGFDRRLRSARPAMLAAQREVIRRCLRAT